MREKYRIEFLRRHSATITKDEAEALVRKYLEDILGEDCYITDEDKLVHCVTFPYWSGTLTDLGDPTEEQRAASTLLKFLSK